MLEMLFLVVALVLFALAAFSVAVRKFNLMAAGLFFLTLALALQGTKL